MKTEILFEDRDILVCYKPAGLAVQSGHMAEPDMVSELKNYLAKSGKSVVSRLGAAGNVRCGIPPEKKPVYLGVVHRLDQPVSGVLVFGKSQRAAAELSRQATDHTMQKIYRAVVLRDEAAALWSGSGTLTDYMVKMPGGGARIAAPTQKDAKKAELSWRVLERKENRALLEIELKTGRHHQIRVQMAHAGAPLLGDLRYGTPESLRLSQELSVKNVQLQAVKLIFKHPATGEKVCYEAEQKLGL